jgi:hypothetical protein
MSRHFDVVPSLTMRSGFRAQPQQPPLKPRTCEKDKQRVLAAASLSTLEHRWCRTRVKPCLGLQDDARAALAALTSARTSYWDLKKSRTWAMEGVRR